MQWKVDWWREIKGRTSSWWQFGGKQSGQNWKQSGQEWKQSGQEWKQTGKEQQQVPICMKGERASYISPRAKELAS